MKIAEFRLERRIEDLAIDRHFDSAEESVVDDVGEAHFGAESIRDRLRNGSELLAG